MSHNPVPLEIIDLLNDDEEIGDEEEGLVEEVEDDGPLDLEKMPVFIKVEDAYFRQIASPSDGTEHEQPEIESDSEEDWEPYEPSLLSVQMLEATDPLTSLAQPPFAAATISSASATRGSPARFRTQRGRARTQRLRMREARGETRWTRGQRLEEVYQNDVDLPANIRDQTQRHSHNVSDEVEEAREEDEIDEFMMTEEFVWRGMDAWNGVKETFEPQLAGPTRSFNSAYDALHAIWTDDIMAHIANESNKHAQATLLRRKDCYETNSHEIWCLVAFWIMLGIIRMPSIKSCFTKIPLLKTDVFRYIFTETRYWNLNAAFHLNATSDPDDPLSPMGPVLDHLNTKFKELYRLDREICIDESQTLWKGPVGFKQYIKTKAARFGIKTYQLCESATGYLWSFFVCVGRASGSGAVPSGVSSVLHLIRPLLHRGHTLYLDDCFNSPSLARWLKRRGTDCVGTLRPCRKHVPVAVKSCPLREGQFVARASDDVMVLALQDRNRVSCISTYHDVSQVYKETRGRPAQFKLQLIDDYNKAMGGVDRLDHTLEAYRVERKKCSKWNTKLFKRLLNISIQNSRILLEKGTGARIDSLAFRLSLVQEILDRHLAHVPRRVKPLSTRNPTFPLQRLTERHFIRRILITEEMRRSIAHRTSLGRRVCVWCTRNGRKRSKTVYECMQCELPLCLEPCFREFHVIPCASNGETVIGS